MKKIGFLLIAVVGIIALFSCADEDADPIIARFESPSVATPASGTAYVLTEANAEEAFDTLRWSAADFGFSAATTYTVQVDNAGGDFSSPLSVGSTNDLFFSITNGDMNQKLLAFDVPFGIPSNMELIVVASVSNLVQGVVSDTIAFTVTPYEVIIIFPSLYAPGSYQSASGYSTGDWSPDTAPQIFSLESDDEYQGYIFFQDNTQFKFTPEPNWDNDWGDTGADGTLDERGENIQVPAEGMYQLDVDIPNLTYTVSRTDWGVIGSATPGGWDADTDMTWDAANQVLTLTVDLIADGEGSRQIKFRANDDWVINLGDDDKNGTLVFGGANIDVAEDGNYTISLDLNGPVYRYTLVKN